MDMTKAEADFLALQILVERAQKDKENVGYYLYKAYELGQGGSIEEALELPAAPAPTLTLVPK